ncbi:bifunctional DNA primase/polymerase [Nocardioides salsibiostraticola]
MGMYPLSPQSRSAGRWSSELAHELTKAPGLVAAAEILVDRDIPVFPCVPGGKRPLTVHGFRDANTNPVAIASWWSRWPNANIGIPTGAVSGVDVVDVDVHPIGTGFPAFERARRAGLVEGWAWLVRTPSGGVHAYFPREADSQQRSWQSSGQHIDFRGDGGYIVLPPSRITGNDGVSRPYRQIAVAEHHQSGPVDAAELRGFLDPPRPMRPPTGMPAIGSRPDNLAAWVAARPEGGRNGGLFWAACRMAEEGHALNAASSVLGDAACAAGLPEREALTTIRSAYRIRARLGSENPPRRVSAVEGVVL